MKFQPLQSKSVRTALTATILLIGSSAAHAVSVSTDILRGGAAGAGIVPAAATPGSSTGLDYVGFINHTDTSPLNVQYNAANAGSIDVGSYVVNGGSRGTPQNIHVNGYTDGNSPGSSPLYFRGEPAVNKPGFGAHANWVVTLDLDIVRATYFGGSAQPLTLTGDFGTWGGIQPGTPEDQAVAGVIQGAVFLDGVRIDEMGQTSAFTEAPVSQSFNESLTTGRYLTFGIFNGNDGALGGNSTVWDDGLFANVNIVPEPSSLGFLALGAIGLAGRRRRQA